MRRLAAFATAVGAASALVSVLLVSSAGASAKSGSSVEATPFPAPCGSGTPIVDVTQTELNGLDSNADGSYIWAYDRTYTIRTRYWQIGSNQFCLEQQLEGTFETITGDSPGGTGIVHAGLTGRFQSVDAFTFTGAYDPGTHQTHGQLATVDLGCHVIDEHHWYCTIAPGNTAGGHLYYFPGGFGNLTLDSGYFYYDAGTHGHWLQLGTRSIGDIIS